tara:strand:+ start:349 stop:489 length:141 start_codon:yes stop_codon:yes gene_type:complete
MDTKKEKNKKNNDDVFGFKKAINIDNINNLSNEKIDLLLKILKDVK